MLLNRLESKIDHLNSIVGEIQTMINRHLGEYEGWKHEVKNQIASLQATTDVNSRKIEILEAVKHRAEGAVWTARVIWVVGIGIASLLGGAVAHAIFH